LSKENAGIEIIEPLEFGVTKEVAQQMKIFESYITSSNLNPQSDTVRIVSSNMFLIFFREILKNVGAAKIMEMLCSF